MIITKNEKGLFEKELICKNVNWISGQKPEFPLKASAKIRYGLSPAQAIIKKQNRSKLKVVFSKPQRAITPGQSIVFYKEQELLGGAIITKHEK